MAVQPSVRLRARLARQLDGILVADDSVARLQTAYDLACKAHQRVSDLCDFGGSSSEGEPRDPLELARARALVAEADLVEAQRHLRQNRALQPPLEAATPMEPVRKAIEFGTLIGDALQPPLEVAALLGPVCKATELGKLVDAAAGLRRRSASIGIPAALMIRVGSCGCLVSSVSKVAVLA